MKEKYKPYPYQFGIKLNKEEYETIKILKKDYAINISQAIKLFLKRQLKLLQENDKNIQI